jgi:L-lysine exporter family protein LysE/ArgO
MSIFVEGLTLGLAYAMPIGAQNIFVLQRGLSNHRSSAFFTAACVSVFDVSLAFACFFGVGKILIAFPFLRPLLLAMGALFLIYVAFGQLQSKQSQQAIAGKSMSFLAISRAAFILTWFNPHAIVDGSILLGSYSAKLSSGDSSLFLLGIALASPLWFTTLTSTAVFFSQRLSPRNLIWINRVSAIVLIFLSFGLLRAIGSST